jgi:uncharacterized protein YbjT (DUF2867 family)
MEGHMVVITGASGKTGSKAAEMLLAKKINVRVLGRSNDHLKWLAEKGATIMTGDQADERFLTNAFSDADAVYLLVPPKLDAVDPVAYYNMMGDVAVSAIKIAGVKRVVFLSSLGAELDSGTGPIVGLHDVENKLEALKNVNLVIIRAGFFMENLLTNVGLIKNQKINGNVASPNAPILMVAAGDVGTKAAELLENQDFTGHSIMELFGDRLSYEKATKIIAEKIGLSQLHYVQFSQHDAVGAMTAMGISKSVSEGFVEMANGISEGKISALTQDPLSPNAPTRFAKFVEEVFVPVYKSAA